jgi:hypothetical protein
MYIDFKNLVCIEAKLLEPQELAEEKKALLAALYHDNVDEGLVQWVETLLDQARETGYHGGYSDAHWYTKGVGDGA